MENEIIEKCQQGNLNEFGKLYDLYIRKIYQFIYFKTHQKEVAEDLTSITFMKALKAIDKFDSHKGVFKTWLYQIARNTVIDHYRSHHPTQNIEDAWEAKDKTDLVQETDSQMKIEAIRKYMENLKPEQREIILLRVWGDHSFNEIAEILGKTEAACKMSFKRVMEKLRSDFIPFLTLLLLLK